MAAEDERLFKERIIANAERIGLFGAKLQTFPTNDRVIMTWHRGTVETKDRSLLFDAFLEANTEAGFLAECRRLGITFRDSPPSA